MAERSWYRNTEENKKNYPTHGECRGTSNVRKCQGKPNGWGITQNTYWRDLAHSNTEDSIGTGNHVRREKTKPKPDLAAERPERARARFLRHAVDASVKCKAV